ncbi:MAG: hypothetical protein E8D45_08825 [Nitrospira sp.]|nr:MAG: hypothetical protein E8D45_08825 [Nitrospira sp.]
MTAESLENLIAGQEAVLTETRQTKGRAEFTEICGSHDDYIWIRTLGSAPTPGATPSEYSFSRYLVCDMARESEADLIVHTAVAPIMEKHLAAGEITQWGWFIHSLGGTYRRILNWGGPSIMAALNAEGMISTDIADDIMGPAFNSICNSHSDYLWHREAGSR